jgi:hypothetical protein
MWKVAEKLRKFRQPKVITVTEFLFLKYLLYLYNKHSLNFYILKYEPG